jgi:nucleotide-binding universal stress UspA family protein
MTPFLPWRKILLPIDFSDNSRRAFDFGAELARDSGAELSLLTVVDDTFPYPELWAWDRPDEEYYRTMRERSLGQMEELLQSAPGIGAQRLVVRGRPREEIAAVAAEVEADLIVMARHGSGGIRAAIMGSTTESVLRTAPCPVLVLPPEPVSEGSSR